jgi:prophage antirepressor-like protein
MKDNQIQIFENSKFGKIRVGEMEGKVYFSGRDVARTLGYIDSRAIVLSYCKSQGVVKCDTLVNGVIQRVTYIDESNFCRLVAKSCSSVAMEFKLWIFNEVVPAMKKFIQQSLNEIKTDKKEENQIQIFDNSQFGKIRVIEINEKIYLIGSDVAKALGYSDPNDAISRHCRYPVKHRISDNQGVPHDYVCIPEGDVYRLAARSKLPGAEKFESWIFDEVLPSIMKTGQYAVKPLSPAEMLLHQAQLLVEQEKRLNTIEQKVDELKSDIEEKIETLEYRLEEQLGYIKDCISEEEVNIALFR